MNKRLCKTHLFHPCLGTYLINSLTAKEMLFAMMPSTPRYKHQDDAPLAQDLSTCDLPNLSRLVLEQVLASFLQPLNVVPISLHLVRTLEHFPTPTATKTKETQP